jgi:GTP-binding protein HflX
LVNCSIICTYWHIVSYKLWGTILGLLLVLPTLASLTLWRFAHVVDSANDQRDRQIEDVNKVLAEISADGIPQLLVLNKTDLKGLPGGIERDENGNLHAVRVSALTGEGLDALRAALVELAPAPSFLAGPAYDIHDTSENTWQ